MQREFPIGTIQSFAGSIANIPSTWRLCDGTRGTPDLRNRFVVGSGDTYSPADTGGNVQHNHDFTGDGHDHVFNFGLDLNAAANFISITDFPAVTGTTDNQDGRPPYYSLAYIMYAGRPI